MPSTEPVAGERYLLVIEASRALSGCPSSKPTAVRFYAAAPHASQARRSAACLSVGQAERSAVLFGYLRSQLKKRCLRSEVKRSERNAVLFGCPASQPRTARCDLASEGVGRAPQTSVVAATNRTRDGIAHAATRASRRGYLRFRKNNTPNLPGRPPKMGVTKKQ